MGMLTDMAGSRDLSILLDRDYWQMSAILRVLPFLGC